MGLDMYLRARRHVAGYSFYDEETIRLYRDLVSTMGLVDHVDPGTPAGQVELTVAYWRKANAIHAWFVSNVQKGEDDCGEYHVSRDQLLALKSSCGMVLDRTELVPGTVQNGMIYNADNPAGAPVLEEGLVVSEPAVAEEHLPTTDGFFFGSTDYNEWYVQDLKDTVAQIERVLGIPEEWSFVYQSSW